MRLLGIIALSALWLTGVSAIPFAHSNPAANGATVVDTVWAPPADSVRVAGFDKALRSRVESVYISNLTDGSISEFALEITYRDMKGRELHKAVHTIQIDLPSGETRKVDFPTFDTQGIYYYHLTPRPARASAVPFKVTAKVRYILR